MTTGWTTDRDTGKIGERFGASVDIARPPPDDAGFFLVTRRPESDHMAFRAWLLTVVGADRLLLGHPDGLFVVHTTFGRAEQLRGHPHVSHVGGVNVDVERLSQALTPPQ